MPIIQQSGYLDAASWRLVDPQVPDVATALGLTDVRNAGAWAEITVAVAVERANDPAALLALPWQERQQAIQAMEKAGTLWTTYGGKAADHAVLKDSLAAYGQVLGQAQGYVDNDTRTVWAHLDSAGFAKAFGTTLKQGVNAAGDLVFFWEGNLSSDGLGVAVAALHVDGVQKAATPVPLDGGVAKTLEPGPQGTGNAAQSGAHLFPNQVAAQYDFPLTPEDGVRTATVGIIAPGSGTRTHGEPIQTLVDRYREIAGTPGSGQVHAGGAGTAPASHKDGERSLDIGVVASVAPNSDIVLYNGTGHFLTAMQAGIWDDRNRIPILSLSYSDSNQAAPDSPFHRLNEELAIDAALRNVTIVFSSGDRGSGEGYGNGVPMLSTGTNSAYVLTVGGTSLTSVAAARTDATLAGLAPRALAHDPATLHSLVGTGLTYLPQDASDLRMLTETVWNEYRSTAGGTEIQVAYQENQTSGSGVDGTRPQPGYQTAFGLNLTGQGPFADHGRGRPDVSALAGGNAHYTVPDDLLFTDAAHPHSNGGTSASAPLWAALLAQIDTIFADQGLPHLGYANDLLYQAAAVAPGAFNDILRGNNTSTFRFDANGAYVSPTSDGPPSLPFTPTGFGYEAGLGYDIASGLGTPNGLLLARALTAMVHAQGHPGAPGLLKDGVSGADQHLLVQPVHAGDASFTVVTGSGGELSFQQSGTSSLAWTNAIAQKALQADFDPALIRILDGGSQARPHDINVGEGDTMTVRIDGATADTYRATLTNPFGFTEYRHDGEAVTLARSVAVAQTAGGADDQDVIVRLRSNTNYDNKLEFYRVDDLAGTIDGIAPGHSGYADAVAGRSYRTAAGEHLIQAPAERGYSETMLTGIDHGDLIAARLTNERDTFWGFAAANETDATGRPVTHLWNYGLNTWGWEDLRGGGDQDFNDLLVQLDFTSASGNAWLA